MKYCVSARQPRSVLQNADQIKFAYADQDRLIDYITDFPDKDFILFIPKEKKDLDWKLYAVYTEKANFMLCIEDLSLAYQCRNRGIKFYWAYPCFTYYELNSVVALQPCYITLGAPLSFDLGKIQLLTETAIRLCPIMTHDTYIPRENNLFSSWIRPEDVQHYEKYAEVFEFAVEDLKREATLLRIYKEDQSWPGNLNLLIPNLGYNIDNRVIDEGLGQLRMNCGQRCMSGGVCRLCETCFKLGNAIRDKHYKDLKQNRDN